MNHNTICAPWQKGAGLSTVILGQGGEAIASVFPGRTSAETNERADLIVAAPDLLAACKKILAELNKEDEEAADIPNAAECLITAIAKAEGRA